MRTYKNSYSVGLFVAALAVGAAAAACSDDDTKPAATSSSSSSSSSSGSSSSSSSSSGTASSSSSSSGGDGGTLSLYDRLGGKAGLEKFVQDTVEKKILTDADLKTYFFNQVATPIPKDHPSAKQIVVCFARFVGTALEKDTYPGADVEDTANTNTPKFKCRSMVDSHKGANTKLQIGTGTFDKFVTIIATELMALVKPTATKVGEITMAELTTLGGALNGQKTDVTTAGVPAGPGPFTAP